MNILFIVPSYKPAYIYGGPIVSVAMLAEHLVQVGNQVTVYTSTANGKTELDVPVEEPVMMNGVKIIYFKRITKDHTHVSPRLWRMLYKNMKQFDVVHIHSWWNFLVLGATFICKLKGVKPVLSPRGMLCEYVFTNQNTGKKKLLHNLVGKRLLATTYLHVTSDIEWNECLTLNTAWKGTSIFNIVELPDKTYARKENRVFTIGYLSRVEGKKGLDILLKALAGVTFNYRLQIAGSGDPAYMEILENLVTTLGIEDKVEWVGWKKDEDKYDFLSGVDLFALTSHNENFAMVVIESLCVGTPVLISEHVGLAGYVKENNLGWITGIKDIDEVKSQLIAAYNQNEERSRITGEAGKIINRDFNGVKLANEYVNFYQKIQ
jgi:glycosyltransferase involved in cell wall biosynthesis